MATTTNLSLIAVLNGTGGHTSWSAISGNSYNRFYTGTYPSGESKIYRRSRVDFSTNNVIISSSKKLVVKVTIAESDFYCNKLVARLSATDIAPNKYYETTNIVVSQAMSTATISKSPAYDMNGSQITGKVTKNTSIQFIFNLADTAIQANKTYYIYFGQEDVRSGTYLTTATVNTITLTHETYTKCGAPSSVSLGGYIVPNGSFTVSWGAGTAGNANNITGYRIYCKSSSSVSSPSTSDKYFDAGKDDRSFTIPASQITNGDQRGWYITCAVQTLGSAGSTYYSDLKTHSGGITINTLPKTNNMTVTASKTILPSTGGTVTFTPSGATDDHHSVSYAYATSATGTKKLISGNSISLNISKKTTVYFWAYDGLEYSTGNKSQTIQINTKPTCKIEATSATQITTSSTVPSDCKYVLSPAFKASKSNTTLGGSNSFTHYYRVYDSSKNLIEEKKHSATGATHSILDIRNVIAVTPPFYYSFGATVNDGIEESEKTWGDLYYITGAPAIINIYNTSSGNNIMGMGSYDDKQNPFYFSKQLCFDFVYDAGYVGKSFALKNSSKSAQVGELSDKSCLRAFFNDCGITASGEHILSGYFLDKVDCSCQASRAMYRIQPFEIKNLSITNCKPHTNKNIYASIASNNLGGAITNPKEFGINAENVVSIDSFVGTLKYQNNTLTQALEIDSEGSGGSTFNFKSFIYNHDSFGVNQDKTYTMAFTLSLTNAFDETYLGSQDITIDYKEVPKINRIDIELPNEGTNEIKEGQEIKIEIDYENCYNSNQKLKIESQYGFETYSNIISEIMGTAEITIIVPKILSHKELSTLTFSITNEAGTSCLDSINKNMVFLKHDTPNVVLTRTDYNDQDKELTIYFSPSDWGLDPILQTAPGANNEPNNNIEISLQAQNGKKTLSFKYNENLKSCTFTNVALSEDDTWESVLISLEITVTSYAYHETTHTQQNTNTILIYNSTPTVAYRKNQLGINTKDPAEREEALIVIGGASGRNQIFYETNQDKPYCQVINFQFNGGVWGSDLDNDDIGVVIDDLTPAENLYF